MPDAAERLARSHKAAAMDWYSGAPCPCGVRYGECAEEEEWDHLSHILAARLRPVLEEAAEEIEEGDGDALRLIGNLLELMTKQDKNPARADGLKRIGRVVVIRADLYDITKETN